MKKTCLTALMMALAAVSATAEMQYNFRGPVKGLTPMVHHVVAPRTAVDLCGEWDYAETNRPVKTVGDKRVPGPFAIDEKLLANLNWQKVEVPYVVRWGVSDTSLSFFRRHFTLSAADAKRQVRLVFEQVGETAELFVNGRFVAKEILTGLDWIVNVSDFVKPGDNLLEVRISYTVPFRKWADYVSIQNWATGMHCGIALPVHVEISDPVFIDEAFVTTKVFPKRQFRADVVVTNATVKAVASEVEVNVRDWDRPLTAKVNVPPHGIATAVVERAWADVKLWSPATPHLYDLDIKVKAGAAADAYRVRFGFREIEFRQKQIAMNGTPFLDYRKGMGFNCQNGDTMETFRDRLHALRKRGIVGLRTFLPNGFKRAAWICDEVGMLESPCLMAGGGAGGKSDHFFKVYHPSQIRRAIRQQRNSPSVICWGLGNEFGGHYGGRDPKTIEAEAALGALVEALDPTRPWTYYGECEVGVPLNKAGGPCPIRSVHYATAPSNSWTPVPHLGRWLVHDIWGWQGPWDRTKPLSCSEDLFHGLTDACVGMAKWSGDHYCSRGGFFGAWWQTLRWYAEGNTLGGLSAWEPWCTYPDIPLNPLFTLKGTPIPDYLLFIEEFEPNVFSGELFTRNLYACNRWFADIDAALSCELAVGSQSIAKWTEDAKLKGGEFRKYAVAKTAPEVKRPTTMTLTMRLVTSDGRELAKEERAFFVFPKVGKVAAAGVAHLAADESDYTDLVAPGRGVFTDVDKALASGAKRIFCDRPLTPADGDKLSRFVTEGGVVLLMEPKPENGNWTPIPVRKLSVRYGWIRNGDVFGDIDERAFHMWGPHDADAWSWKVSPYAIPKPSGLDCAVWLDAGSHEGVKDALALKLTLGRGAWIMCTLPLADKADGEPCAGWTLKLLVDRLVKEKVAFGRQLSVRPSNGAYAELFADLDIHTAAKPGKPSETVLVVDATEKKPNLEKVSAYARAGGTVWVMEPQAAADIPSDWPVVGVERKAQSYKPKGNGEDWSDYASFVWRTSNRGLMAGVSNEALMWYAKPNDLLRYWQHMDLGEYPATYTDTDFALGMRLQPKAGTKDVLCHTEPCGLVEFPLGKGRVIVSTLRLIRNRARMGEAFDGLLRTLANNCGVRTCPPDWTRVPRWIPMENRLAWNAGFCTLNKDGWMALDRRTKGEMPEKGGKGWFDNGNDMRHFPVEQTESMRGNAPFPTGLMPFGGVKFRIVNPYNPAWFHNRACTCVAPGGETGWWYQSDPDLKKPGARLSCRRIWLLCAAEKGGAEIRKAAKNGKEPVVRMEIMYRNDENQRRVEKLAFKPGVHFGGYAEAEDVTVGRVAWRGPTQTGKDGALYLFSCDLPEQAAGRRLEVVKLFNDLGVKFMVVAATAEE